MLRYACLIVLFFSFAAHGQSAKLASGPNTYRNRPVFIPNLGQWEGDFLYKTRLGSMTVFVQRNGWTFTLEEYREKPKDENDPKPNDPRHREWQATRGVAVAMHFADASPVERVAPGSLEPGYHNYFLGNDSSKWRSFVPLYDATRLEKA